MLLHPALAAPVVIVIVVAVAVVVIVDEATPREGWGSDIASTSVQARLIGFAPELLEFLSLGRNWNAWSL